MAVVYDGSKGNAKTNDVNGQPLKGKPPANENVTVITNRAKTEIRNACNAFYEVYEKRKARFDWIVTREPYMISEMPAQMKILEKKIREIYLAESGGATLPDGAIKIKDKPSLMPVMYGLGNFGHTPAHDLAISFVGNDGIVSEFNISSFTVEIGHGKETRWWTRFETKCNELNEDYNKAFMKEARSNLIKAVETAFMAWQS